MAPENYYPQHIYDPIRLQIATELYQKELRKLLPGLEKQTWNDIDKTIIDWRENPLNYRLEHDGVREFWDIFASLIESVKLKPDFTAWLTAKNVSWELLEVSIEKIELSSASYKLSDIPNLKIHDDLTLQELDIAMSAQPESFWLEKQAIVERYSQDQTQNSYPIILKKMPDDLLKTLDGNRRSLLAYFHHNPTIKAWVGQTEGDDLKDYWVPVNDLMQLAKTYQTAARKNQLDLKNALIEVLKHHFSESQVAKLAYRQRVYPYSAHTREFYDLAIS